MPALASSKPDPSHGQCLQDLPSEPACIQALLTHTRRGYCREKALLGRSCISEKGGEQKERENYELLCVFRGKRRA